MSAITSWFTSVPLDWIILAAFGAIVTIDAIRSGTTRATALALALPVAAFLLTLSGSTAFIGPITSASEMTQAIAFLALTVAVFVLAYRGMGYGDEGSPLQSVMAGVGTTVIAISVWVSTDVLRTMWDFSPSIDAVFGSAYAVFWIVGGLVVVTLSRR